MHVELITLGDELCRGEIVDTNAAWLAAQLWDMQITVSAILTCGDIPSDMESAIQNAAQRSDLVLVCGGLGPTVDDCTVDVVSGLVGAAAIEHAESATRMKNRFAQLGIPLSGDVMRQVRHPQGSTPYINPTGAAPGFEVLLPHADNSGPPCTLICLPGPPREMKALFTEHLKARITEFRLARGELMEFVAKKVFHVFGKGESVIALALEGVVFEDGASLHYQVQFPETLVKLVVHNRDEEEAKKELTRLESQVRARLGELIYGEDSDTLPLVLGKELQHRGETIATAESCTGGMIASMLTDAPGASAYFLGSAVTYSNAEKTRQLGVSEEVLAEHGAVSEAVVIAMARGLCERSGSSWGVSVSGIAGPDGGSKEKPVGTVWIAVAGPNEQLFSKKYSWGGSRDQVRRLTAYWALDAVRRQMKIAISENEEK